MVIGQPILKEIKNRILPILAYSKNFGCSRSTRKSIMKYLALGCILKNGIFGMRGKKINSIFFSLSLALIVIGISLAFTRVIELEMFGLLMILIGSFGFLFSATMYAYKRDISKGKDVDLISYILLAISLVILRVLFR